MPSPPTAPPPKVTGAAAAGGMGALQLAQRGDNPFANFLLMLLLCAGCIGLMFGFGWLATVTEIRAIAFLVIPCIAGAIVFVIWAFMALFRGFRDTYVYENGLVHRNNWKVEVMPWGRLDEVLLWKAGGNTALRGKLLAYVAVSFDGLKISVPYKTGGDPEGLLGKRIVAIAQHLGRPIVDSGPYTGRMRV